MHICRLRIVGNADRSNPSFASQSITQHHDQRQRQAVRKQLHRLPTRHLIPQLPAIGIATQAAKCHWMCQQNLPRQQPDAVNYTQRNTEQKRPDWNRKKKQRTQREQLGHKICRQQLPRGMPAAFERITWAGHDPGSCEPCAEVPDLPIRRVP